MDKLMNAANESGGNSKLNDGEYVFYILRRQENPESYTLLFMGESPSNEGVMTVTIDMFESEYIHNERHAKYDEIRSTLQELFDKEEPVYCLILNNLILAKSLYKTVDTTMKTMKTIMMVSPEPEVITEDMARYKLPKWSHPSDIGSANWFMNKYASKPNQCNSAYAVLFNNTIVDIVWYRTKVYRLNLLDLLEEAVERDGWTASGLASHICTYKGPK